MNKRQRKKRHKKTMARIGAAMSTVVSDFIKTQLSRPSIASTFLMPLPIIHAPYRQWQMVEDDPLVHHIGINTRHGVDYWMRFCDGLSVNREYVLNYEKTVNCLQCIAREAEVRSDAARFGGG